MKIKLDINGAVIFTVELNKDALKELFSRITFWVNRLDRWLLILHP